MATSKSKCVIRKTISNWCHILETMRLPIVSIPFSTQAPHSINTSLGSRKYIHFLGLYLSTQMEITQQNCSFWTGNQENYKDQEKEAKHEVHLMRPENKNDSFKINFEYTESPIQIQYERRPHFSNLSHSFQTLIYPSSIQKRLPDLCGFWVPPDPVQRGDPVWLLTHNSLLT